VPLALRVHSLWKSYAAGVAGCSARVWVLRAASLDVHEGECVAILGARGAGTTTLLHCLAGLRRVDAGTIEHLQRPRLLPHACSPNVRHVPPRAGDIVLVHTGRDAFIKERDYMDRGCGVSAAATRWLYERGVRVMGIDAWGWDGPLHIQAEAARETGRPGVFWAAHQVDLPYSQIERLVNLGALPPTGFTVACFPLRIEGASAAPARIVAILD